MDVEVDNGVRLGIGVSDGVEVDAGVDCKPSNAIAVSVSAKEVRSGNCVNLAAAVCPAANVNWADRILAAWVAISPGS